MVSDAGLARPAAALTVDPQSRLAFFAVIGGLIIVLAVILTEPVCREGFVASMSFGGWVCVPGYKPNR
jgi:hypothetical protein